MNIQGTIISDTEIIGIGALMMERKTDAVSMSLYSSYRLYFDVFCKSSSFNLKSEWIDRSGHNDDVLQKMKANAESFKSDYNKARLIIADKIGEKDDVNEKAFDHDLKKLGKLYEDGKDKMQQLSVFENDPETADKLFDIIREMRDLAAITMKKLYTIADN